MPLHAELWGRYSMFCGAAVFRPAKGLVPFFATVPQSLCHSPSYAGLMVLRLHLSYICC